MLMVLSGTEEEEEEEVAIVCLVSVSVMADEYSQSDTNQHTHDVFSLAYTSFMLATVCYLHSIDNY